MWQHPAHPPPRPEIIAAFAALLRSSGSIRIDATRLRQLWEHADPGWAHTDSQRTRLLHALEKLHGTHTIELPASNGPLWDPGSPRLPLRITVPDNRRPVRALPGPADEPWHLPTLHWAADFLRTQHPTAATRHDLIAINQWLLSTAGAAVPEVAREERSLHIFNDEKRLAHLSSGTLFDPGRLTLAHLSCTEPYGALGSAWITSQGPVLIVENKATFDSAWRALRCQPDPAYAAVIFGSGHAVASLVHDLAAIDQLLHVHATRFDYAGDVDAAGVNAAQVFLSKARERHLPATMATPLWDAVARADPTGPDPSANDLATPAALRAATECALPAAVLARLNARIRVPQERIDRTLLADAAWWTPGQV